MKASRAMAAARVRVKASRAMAAARVRVKASRAMAAARAVLPWLRCSAALALWPGAGAEVGLEARTWEGYG